MTSKKPFSKVKKILFCGAFTTPKNGSTGGVLYACRTFLDSDLARQQSWALIDSTQPQPPPSLPVRLLKAGGRWLGAIRHLLFGNVGATLVFTPFLTMSLLEKMSICLVSGLLKKPTAVAFRSEIKLGGASKFITYPLLRLAFSQITCVICQSNEARAELETLFPKTREKYVTIPNWIDLSNQQQKITNQFSSDAELSESPITEIQISFIGWLEPIKDVETILRALANTNQSQRNWKLSVCGNGSQSEILNQLATDLGIAGKVVFRGWVGPEEKKQVLQQTDIFVMASLSEGMPNSLIEAMAIGLPVVTSNVGGIPTLVEHEKNGLLFEPQDTTSLGNHISRLINDPELRQQMSDANVAKIKEHHDSKIAVQKILKLLKINTDPTL